MNTAEIQRNLKLSLPVSSHIYKGLLDDCQVRNGKGKEAWTQEWEQKYDGMFLNDCLHSRGTYQWIYGKSKFTYEGKFYANNLEGYGVLSYPNGNTFEGLFRQNKRYGPGVLSYTNGTQDVGLWDDTNLIRLSCKVYSENIPSLAKSSRAKAYLTQYKKIVSLVPNNYTEAEQVLVSLEASKKVLNNYSQICNKFIRNPKSIFFDRKFYDNQFFSDTDDLIVDIIISFEDDEPLVQQVTVTDILAWNNEEVSISLMKHAFLHRKFESTLSFSIVHVLEGARYEFDEAGYLESVCIHFLQACYDGEHRTVSKLIIENDLNPNVCDVLGNSGIIFASGNDQHTVITTLVDFGVNLDYVNNENLTPLLLCILRYISYKNKVQDWEKAFIPNIIPRSELQQWRPYLFYDNHKDDVQQDYILDIRCAHPIVLSAKKGKKDRKEKKPKKEKQKKGKKKVEDKIPEPTAEEIRAKLAQEMLESKLEIVFNTILLLLHYGADTNFGEVPLPPLILSIFARNEDIIRELISNGASCNITTSYHDGSLTPLHIVASLKPSRELISVAEILLNNGADSRRRANTEHWIEEKQIIEAGCPTEDFGKTSLHLLSMRYDFIQDPEDYLGILFDTFVRNYADPEEFYLGHNPLTLAVLRGNINLIKRIIATNLVNPNQCLPNKMGVPLTVLILKRYKEILPLDVCKKVFDTLIGCNANPFNNMPDFDGNCIEFCAEENKPEEMLDDKGKKGKKNKKKGKKDKHDQVIQLLNANAYNVLDRHIKGTVVKTLYEYKIECDISDPVFNEMVKFIDVNDTVRILQEMMNKGLMEPDRLSCFAMLIYVQDNIKNLKDKGKKKNKGKKDKKNKSEVSEKCLEDILEEMSFKKVTQLKQKYQSPSPELDQDELKYKVCYNCLERHNKELIRCPKCEMIYFCSEQCNKANLKRKTIHTCKGSFYNSEKKRIAELKSLGEYTDDKLNRFKIQRQHYLANPNLAFERKYRYNEILLKKISKNKEGKESKKKGRDDSKETRTSRTKSAKTDKGKKRKGESSISSDLKAGKKKTRKGSDGGSDTEGHGKTKKTTDEKMRKGKKGDGADSAGVDKKSRSKSKKDERDAKKKKRKGSRDSSEESRSRSKNKKRGKTGADRSKSKAGKKGDIQKDLARGKSPDLKDGGKKEEVGASGVKGVHKGEGEGGKLVPLGAYDREKGTGGEDEIKLGDKCKTFLDDIAGLFEDGFNLDSRFLPFVILVDGQLYYKFGEIDAFIKLTYSSV